MQPEKIIESMHEQVRAIHRAVTGEDVHEANGDQLGLPQPDELITRRFAELEMAARAMPSVATRVPPFSFVPPIDVIAGPDTVILELAVPGVDREDVTIQVDPGALVIAGIRRDDHAATNELFHAEIPRGPFSRVVPLPAPVTGEPRIELERGVLRIHLRLVTANGHDAAR